MKTLLAIAATALLGLVVPQAAEAGHSSYRSGHTYQCGRSSCGCPIYTKRVVSSYDCFRQPVYRYYSVPVVHRCSSSRSHSYLHYTPSSYSSRRSYNRGYWSNSSYYRGSYNRGHSRSSYSRGCR
ncbi:MAG: hypothetical protein OSA48_08850 [Akkermansiaceae bacterium]|nr:hypothetical protein [Akkermansiaceae bacterium]